MSCMDDIRAQLKADGMRINSQSILELITGHDTAAMLEGVRYYRSRGDIVNRKMYYYDNSGQRVEDETRENHKLINNWHKLLVDQKVSYLVGKPMAFSVEDTEDDKTDVFSEKIELLLGDEWDDTIADIATNASNKGAEWLHMYIDQKGYFKYVIVPCEEVIPIYDSSLRQNLESVLRYYGVKVNGVDRCRVEWWTRNDVTIFLENEDGEFVLDNTEPENPASHFKKNKAGRGWGKVPFIEFPNNSMRTSDLEVTKSLIDEYDLSFSDFANNNADVQEVITILKGYEGTSLAEFRQNLRYFKAIKVRAGNDSGVSKLEFNIPVESKKELLDRLEENIFMFGQGVNTKTDKFGNSPSGASLEFLYTLLDLKASMMERKFRRSVKRLLWFVTEYINMEFNHTFNSHDVKAAFRKNMVQNVKEIVDTLKASRDMISDETIVSQHPMIENPTDEYQKLLEQRGEASKKVIDLKDVDLYE